MFLQNWYNNWYLVVILANNFPFHWILYLMVPDSDDPGLVFWP
jgi:hypothetical protein